ncbi:hypothetical protein [Staphylococcus pseudintermedius]|uniref:hypothetical protein n=1 Tax=Staphylococcus pseudintermedius TaxID=283734 RepID=UPI001E5AEA9F|nr:hypothetical protein [Staphylococcus pseudintermedius]
MIASLKIIYDRSGQMESEVEVDYNILDMGRNFAKLEVTMFSANQHVEKALIICQLLAQ